MNKYLKGALEIAAFAFVSGVVTIATNSTKPASQEQYVHYYEVESCGYSDAVAAIISSNLYDSEKNSLIRMIPKGADSELYSSIVAVAESDMFWANKRIAIEDLCQK